MMNQFDGTANNSDSPEVRLRSIYDMLIADAGNVREVIQNVLDRTEGRYLVIRDTEGRTLIRVSFVGGMLILALALFVTRLRWVPFLPLILLVVFLRLSFQMDQNDDAGQAVRNAGNDVKDAANDAGNRARTAASRVGRDVQHAADNVKGDVKDAADAVKGDVKDAANQ